MKYPKELIKGTTKDLILAVLRDGELYGYQIVKQISDKSSGRLEFGEGSVYPALHALGKDRLLSSHWVPQQGKPDRKYYALTQDGQKALAHNVEQWKDFSAAVGNVFGTAKLVGSN
jgi:PadR family transcriptional regulator, regulatory protein PadR